MNPIAILAAISGEQVLYAIIWLIVAGLVFWVIQWAINQIGIPEPFNKIVRVILVLLVAIVCINVLLSLAGHPLIKW